MSLFKSLLAPALAGLALIAAIWAPAAQAGDLYVPTYGYAAQHYGTPRGCCGAAPCCIPAPCCVQAQPYPPAYGYYDDRRGPPPCRDPRACRPCGCAGDITLGPGFAHDGGVGPIPEGGYGGGGGYVMMDGGGSAGAWSGSNARASARASASASASSAVSIRIGGGHGGGHSTGCGGGCGHH